MNYSKNQIAIIQQEVKRNPDNIAFAMENAKDRLLSELGVRRTVGALQQKWHSSLKGKEELFKLNSNTSSNVKNVKSKGNIVAKHLLIKEMALELPLAVRLDLVKSLFNSL